MSIRRVKLTGLLVLALLVPGSSQAQQAAPSAAVTASVSSGSTLIIENASQWPAPARFQVWDSPLGAGTTWLADDAIWISILDTPLFTHPSPLSFEERGEGPGERGEVHGINLKLSFPGSNPDVRIESFDPLTTTISYFIGDDPERWHPAVPVYGGVRYADLYPSIDLVIGGRDGGWRLEAKRGAAIDQVRIQVEGAEIVGIEGHALQLDVDREPLSIALPAASFTYPVAGLSQQGQTIALSADGRSTLSEHTHPADTSAHLIYSTFLGGSGMDYGAAIALDRARSAYVTGETTSNNFPTTPGAFATGFSGGSYDAFVVKLNPAGSSLIYATFLGGSSMEVAHDIDVDRAGSATIMGWTWSTNFPTTLGAFDTSHNGSYDTYVVKLNPTGRALIYATYLGASRDDNSGGIAVDKSGHAYVVGYSDSTDFPITPGAFDASQNGGSVVFVVKFDSTGSSLIYATFLGGSGSDYGIDIALDQTGNAYVTGFAGSTDFPTTPGALDTSNNGRNDVFVAKLTPTGDALVYATFLGSSENDYGYDIAVDQTGNAYVTGYTESIHFPTTPGAFDTSYNGDQEVFVAKLSPTGSALVYATLLGGGSFDCGLGIAVDRMRNAYVTGYTHSSDFPTTPGAFDTSYNGGDRDAFVVKLNATGDTLVYGTFLGDDNGDVGENIAIAGTGYAYLTGYTDSPHFPTTSNAFDTSHNGSYDAFMVKLNAVYIANVVAPIEQPSAGTFVTGTITLQGFAIDLTSSAGTGIDRVHIYLDGLYDVGGATYGLDRPDIAARYGARYGPSGWELVWDASGATPGVHSLYLYAHRTTDDAWTVLPPHLVVVRGEHGLWLPLGLKN